MVLAKLAADKSMTTRPLGQTRKQTSSWVMTGKGTSSRSPSSSADDLPAAYPVQHMRVLLPLFVLAVAGCVTTQHPEEIDFSDTPERDIEFRRVWSRGDLSELRIRNISGRTVRYLHWAAQGPEPVAYCAREDGTHWLCSERVYVEGDDSSGYVEWTHDTVLKPRSSVTFRVRAGADTKVGIKVFPAGSGEEAFVWVDEQSRQRR